MYSSSYSQLKGEYPLQSLPGSLTYAAGMEQRGRPVYALTGRKTNRVEKIHWQYTDREGRRSSLLFTFPQGELTPEELLESTAPIALRLLHSSHGQGEPEQQFEFYSYSLFNLLPLMDALSDEELFAYLRTVRVAPRLSHEQAMILAATDWLRDSRLWDSSVPKGLFLRERTYEQYLMLAEFIDLYSDDSQPHETVESRAEARGDSHIFTVAFSQANSNVVTGPNYYRMKKLQQLMRSSHQKPVRRWFRRLPKSDLELLLNFTVDFNGIRQQTLEDLLTSHKEQVEEGYEADFEAAYPSYLGTARGLGTPAALIHYIGAKQGYSPAEITQMVAGLQKNRFLLKSPKDEGSKPERKAEFWLVNRLVGELGLEKAVDLYGRLLDLKQSNPHLKARYAFSYRAATSMPLEWYLTLHSAD